MIDALKIVSDYAERAISYLQNVRIVEIRQSLDFIGVHHVECLTALLVFLALQFTKVTFILILACLIAFTIFYMWDTLFPELGENHNKYKKARAYPPYGAGYGPHFGIDQASGSQNVASFLINSNESFRDARTSALFPPFSRYNTAEFGDQSNNKPRRPQRAAGATFNSNRFQPRRPTISGTITPIGHRISTSDVRSNKHVFANHMEEFRQMRRNIDRDPQTFRRMVTNEYRATRPSMMSDFWERNRYQNLSEDTRPRRAAAHSLPDDKNSKDRRGSDNKNSSPKRSIGNDQADRLRFLSRENLLRRLRIFPIPTSRTSGINNRLDPSSPHGNQDNGGSKKRSGRSKIITVPINTVVELSNMSRLVAENSPEKDAKSSCSDSILECDCNNDSGGKLCECQLKKESPIVRSSDSYPYVIEPVHDSSEENMLVNGNKSN